jgi:hypothetical protein
MVRVATCLALIVCALAVHEHYKHLDLDYVAKETRRLLYMTEEQMYEKIENNKLAVKVILERHKKIFDNLGNDEAQERWKKDFEGDFCDDFDRALIAQTLCNM